MAKRDRSKPPVFSNFGKALLVGVVRISLMKNLDVES